MGCSKQMRDEPARTSMSHRTVNMGAVFCTSFLLGMSGACVAANGYWLKDAPVGRMTKQDFDIANPVIHRALDEGRDGQVYEWKNPATGASGSITLRSAPMARNDTTCRRAQFMVSAGGLENVSTWTLCKLPDGWKAVDG